MGAAMYVYSIVFFVCLTLGLLSLKFKTHDTTIKLILVALTFLLAFRYGQGTDYFSYNVLFNENYSISRALKNGIGHGEIGFKLLCAVFNGNYQAFVFFVSLYQGFLLYRFLKKHCDNMGFSLLLFIPTIFLTYYFSAIRQGIVVATFIGIGISLIESKSWKSYVLMCVILSTIHSVALVYLLIPLVTRVRHYFSLALFLPVSAVIGVLLGSEFGIGILLRIPYIGQYLGSYLKIGYSWFAIAERVVTLTLVLLLYRASKFFKNGHDPWWIKAYILGYILYFTLMPFSTLSTRTLVCYRVLEVMFIPNMIKNTKGSIKLVTTCGFLALTIVMYVHHVDGYLKQGNYYSNVNILNYPYVSVFDKASLWSYRESDKYYEILNKP